MSAQQLIYRAPAPVHSVRHARVHVEPRADFAHARGAHSMPVMTSEFALAAAEFPIVFAAADGAVLPVLALGARAGESLFVDAQGRWGARFLPAFLRRYPFVYAQGEGDQFTLCIDEAYPGLNDQGRGEALFGPDGQPSAYVQQVIRFLQEYRHQFERSRAFGERLQALGLLQPMRADLVLPDGQLTTLGGFLAVDRERLKALPAEALQALVRDDALELVYLHLQSLRHFETLRRRLLAAAASPAEPAPTAEPAAA
jgi:hypothetical protein